MSEKLAEVRLSCGRLYLSVAGFAVSMEGDKCRDSNIPEEFLEPIPAEEMTTATIGGKPISEMSVNVVRFFRGDNWTEKMLEYVAAKINGVSSDDAILIDETWLELHGWQGIGNTWYPPESSHPRQFDSPILYWCRVDGAISLPRNEWKSSNDATRGQIRGLCRAMEIRFKEKP